MLSSKETLKGIDPRTIVLDFDSVLEICGSDDLVKDIIVLNPGLEFLCDPFGHDYNRLVFFKNDTKYSILKLDPYTEDAFNNHRMLPKIISPKVHNFLCKSNIIKEALCNEWLFNFCLVDDRPIIYDEEIYVNFLKYNIDDLPDFIGHYVSKYLGAFQFYAFDDDGVMCIYKNHLVTLLYKDIIPMFEPKCIRK